MPEPGKRRLALAPMGGIERCILLVRGHKVILDSHLAALYGVETRVSCSSRQTEHGPVPRRFHVTAYLGRSSQLEITICDLRRRLDHNL